MSGCPTTYELTQWFKQVHKEGRRSALVPEDNTGLLGQVGSSTMVVIVIVIALLPLSNPEDCLIIPFLS